MFARKCFAALALLFFACEQAPEVLTPTHSNPSPALGKISAYDPIPEWAYMGHRGAPFVSVFDLPTMAELTRIWFPADNAYNIALSGDQKYAYVTHSSPASLSKLDLADFSIANTLALPEGSDPIDLALTPNSKLLFVTLYQLHAVAAIDAENMAIIIVIPLTDDTDLANGIAMGPGGQKVFVANQGSGRVHVIDVKSLQVLTAIESGFSSVNELAVTQDGLHVFGTAINDMHIVVISTRSLEVTGTIALGHGPTGIDIPANGNEAYVVGGGRLSVIDTKSLSLVTTFGIPGARRIGVNRNGHLAISVGGPGATLIDLRARSVLTTTEAGGWGPWGVAFGKRNEQALAGEWTRNPANGHYYRLIDESIPWQDAEAIAVAWGGHLVTLNDAEEEAWIRDTFGSGEHFWIGFNDIAQEGDWVWSSGEPVSYTNWADWEPNNCGGGPEPGCYPENAAIMNWCNGGSTGPEDPCFGDRWNDIPIDGGARGIVEKAKK